MYGFNLLKEDRQNSNLNKIWIYFLQNKTIKRGSQAIQSYVWDFNVAYMEVGIASGNQKNINWKNVLVDTASGLAVGAIAGTKNKTVIFHMKNWKISLKNI